MLVNKTAWSAALRYTHYTTNVLTLALSYPKNLNTGYATHTVEIVIPMKIGDYIYPTVEGAVGQNVKTNPTIWTSYDGEFIKSI